VRLVPVGEEFVADCEVLADALPGRVDIDDSDDSVGKKIRKAEKEWINLIVVMGEKEKSSGQLPIRMRSGEMKVMTKEQLMEEIARLSEGYPTMRLPLPRMLSKRPVFRG
ncbi:MAG: His/Gly/Thr/Pro-type tRNA ligase C-terminal domain-containing protein, partial [Thermoplasmata archaeon]|nr:His/Gly/Thr/Pro-type tRNA ligase C-terminal domain-containing protein [Thermoplasmata archaeon]